MWSARVGCFSFLLKYERDVQGSRLPIESRRAMKTVSLRRGRNPVTLPVPRFPTSCFQTHHAFNSSHPFVAHVPSSDSPFFPPSLPSFSWPSGKHLSASQVDDMQISHDWFRITTLPVQLRRRARAVPAAALGVH